MSFFFSGALPTGLNSSRMFVDDENDSDDGDEYYDDNDELLGSETLATVTRQASTAAREAVHTTEAAASAAVDTVESGAEALVGGAEDVVSGTASGVASVAEEGAELVTSVAHDTGDAVAWATTGVEDVLSDPAAAIGVDVGVVDDDDDDYMCTLATRRDGDDLAFLETTSCGTCKYCGAKWARNGTLHVCRNYKNKQLLKCIPAHEYHEHVTREGGACRGAYEYDGDCGAHVTECACSDEDDDDEEWTQRGGSHFGDDVCEHECDEDTKETRDNLIEAFNELKREWQRSDEQGSLNADIRVNNFSSWSTVKGQFVRLLQRAMQVDRGTLDDIPRETRASYARNLARFFAHAVAHHFEHIVKNALNQDAMSESEHARNDARKDLLDLVQREENAVEEMNSALTRIEDAVKHNVGTVGTDMPARAGNEFVSALSGGNRALELAYPQQ